MGTDRVIPVVIFLRTGKQRDHLRLGSDKCAYMEFRYLMCKLKSMPSARYYNSSNIVALLNLPNMAYPPENRLEVYLAAQTGLARLEKSPEKRRKYAEFIDFYADLSEEEALLYYNNYLLEFSKKNLAVGIFIAMQRLVALYWCYHQAPPTCRWSFFFYQYAFLQSLTTFE